MSTSKSFLHQLRYCVAKIEGDSFTIVRVTSMPTAASPKARNQFDYASLDAATSYFVRQQTGEIRALMKRTVESIVEIGKKLILVKEKLGHGRFLYWLEAEFEWSWDTAKRFMRVTEVFGQNQQLADFNLAPSALYELAAPSTPEPARDEALKRAKAGESITYTTAKAIKQKYATPPKPKLESILQPQAQLLPTLPTPAPPSHSGSKLEIVAFRPQTQAPAIPEAARIIASQTGVAASAPRADQTGTVPDAPGVWWQLGGKHLLYCGDPNSPEFMGRVTEKVSLLLAFPPNSDWQPAIRADVRTIMNEQLPQSQNPDLLDEILESNLLYHSKVESLVVSCFLPSLEILSVINRLDRRGLIAEPDPRRVNALISDWKKAGLKVERVS